MTGYWFDSHRPLQSRHARRQKAAHQRPSSFLISFISTAIRARLALPHFYTGSSAWKRRTTSSAVFTRSTRTPVPAPPGSWKHCVRWVAPVGRRPRNCCGRSTRAPRPARPRRRPASRRWVNPRAGSEAEPARTVMRACGVSGGGYSFAGIAAAGADHRRCWQRRPGIIRPPHARAMLRACRPIPPR